MPPFSVEISTIFTKRTGKFEYKNNGSIPTSTEAHDLEKKYGRFYDNGKLIWKSSTPIF
jgi:hypothetical protein